MIYVDVLALRIYVDILGLRIYMAIYFSGFIWASCSS